MGSCATVMDCTCIGPVLEFLSREERVCCRATREVSFNPLERRHQRPSAKTGRKALNFNLGKSYSK